MTDLIYTHISARVPGPEHHFLINAFGLLWRRSGIDARQSHARRRDRRRPDRHRNQRARATSSTARCIARARRRRNASCTRTRAAGIAVSAQEEGLLPLSQHAMRFTTSSRITTTKASRSTSMSRPRLVADLGEHKRDDPAQPRPAHLWRIDSRSVRSDVLPRAGVPVADRRGSPAARN